MGHTLSPRPSIFTRLHRKGYSRYTFRAPQQAIYLRSPEKRQEMMPSVAAASLTCVKMRTDGLHNVAAHAGGGCCRACEQS